MHIGTAGWSIPRDVADAFRARARTSSAMRAC